VAALNDHVSSAADTAALADHSNAQIAILASHRIGRVPGTKSALRGAERMRESERIDRSLRSPRADWKGTVLERALSPCNRSRVSVGRLRLAMARYRNAKVRFPAVSFDYWMSVRADSRQ